MKWIHQIKKDENPGLKRSIGGRPQRKGPALGFICPAPGVCRGFRLGSTQAHDKDAHAISVVCQGDGSAVTEQFKRHGTVGGQIDHNVSAEIGL